MLTELFRSRMASKAEAPTTTNSDSSAPAAPSYSDLSRAVIEQVKLIKKQKEVLENQNKVLKDQSLIIKTLQVQLANALSGKRATAPATPPKAAAPAVKADKPKVKEAEGSTAALLKKLFGSN